MRKLGFIAGALLSIAYCYSIGAAQIKPSEVDERQVANFYRGKIVRIVVGFPPGGGADVYSRLIARHLGGFIPGNPTLAVTNMPGAGSIIAGNYIFTAARATAARSACSTAR